MANQWKTKLLTLIFEIHTTLSTIQPLESLYKKLTQMSFIYIQFCYYWLFCCRGLLLSLSGCHWHIRCLHAVSAVVVKLININSTVYLPLSVQWRFCGYLLFILFACKLVYKCRRIMYSYRRVSKYMVCSLFTSLPMFALNKIWLGHRTALIRASFTRVCFSHPLTVTSQSLRYHAKFVSIQHEIGFDFPTTKHCEKRHVLRPHSHMMVCTDFPPDYK